jgi:hypothetical protein
MGKHLTNDEVALIMAWRDEGVQFATIARRLNRRATVIKQAHLRVSQGHKAHYNPNRLGYVVFSYHDHRELASLKRTKTYREAVDIFEAVAARCRVIRYDGEVMVEEATGIAWRMMPFRSFQQEYVDFYRQLGLALTVAGKQLQEV